MFQEVLDLIATVKSERVNYAVSSTRHARPDSEVGSVWREQYFETRATWIVKKCQPDVVADSEGFLTCALMRFET